MYKNGSAEVLKEVEGIAGVSVAVLDRYYDILAESAADNERFGLGDEFEPSMRLPLLDERMRQYLSVATAQFFELGAYEGIPLRLLDLRANPNTQTTKTLASTLIVARAIRHIQETGECIMLFSPSSGNKAIALRDAVLRALQAKLVHEEQLRVVTLTPIQTVDKLRNSELYENPRLRALNPVFVLDSDSPERVKVVGHEFKEKMTRANLTGLKLWHSLRLENYRFSDQVRALFDFEYGDAWNVDRKVAHVHAVSSAYGLLGYLSGLKLLRRNNNSVASPSFLLVQHLATSDMVLHLLDGDFSGSSTPNYSLAPCGLWTQSGAPHFPATTWSLDEVLEQTFYTHEPATADEMSAAIRESGGSGIIVSLHECLQRYGECVQLLANTPVRLPSDPRDLREWSLVMALCGCLNAIDRGLLPNIDGCTIHASGSYSVQDYNRIPVSGLTYIKSVEEMLAYFR